MANDKPDIGCKTMIESCNFSKELFDTIKRMHERIDKLDTKVDTMEKNSPSANTITFMVETSERHIGELKTLVSDIKLQMEQYQIDNKHLSVRLGQTEERIDAINIQMMKDNAAVVRVRADAWTQRISTLAGIMFICLIAGMAYTKPELAKESLFQWIAYGSIAYLFKDGIASALVMLKNRIIP